jgi:hypothetical protein
VSGEGYKVAMSGSGDLYFACSGHSHNDYDDVYLYTFQLMMLSGSTGAVTNLTTLSISEAVRFFMVSPFDGSVMLSLYCITLQTARTSRTT